MILLFIICCDSLVGMTKPFYNNAVDLETKCDEYFDHCDSGTIVQVVRRGEAVNVKKAIPYTVPGLAVFLGYADRHSIHDLAQNPAFSATIRRARTRIAQQRLEKALVGEQDSRFAQFDLINNHGYMSSKQQVQVEQHITFSDDELNARLENLENKMERIEAPENARVIEGEFQAKLLE